MVAGPSRTAPTTRRATVCWARNSVQLEIVRSTATAVRVDQVDMLVLNLPDAAGPSNA
jgi:hypothetical protein